MQRKAATREGRGGETDDGSAFDSATNPAPAAALNQIQPLTPDEARQLTHDIKRDTQALWAQLLRAYEGGAHIALGYSSWAAYCSAEFAMGRSHAYRMLDSARVIDALPSPIGDAQIPTSEAVARELTPLLDQPDEMRAVWREVVETAPRDKQGQPVIKAKQIRLVVDKDSERNKAPPAVIPGAAVFQQHMITDMVEAVTDAIAKHGIDKLMRAPRSHAARHESGHAVARAAFGRTVESAEVMRQMQPHPNGGRFEAWGGYTKAESLGWLRTPRLVAEEALHQIAGLAAERATFGSDVVPMSSLEEVCAARLHCQHIAAVIGLPDVAEAIFDAVMVTAEELISTYAEVNREIAHMLMRAKHVDAKRLAVALAKVPNCGAVLLDRIATRSGVAQLRSGA
jgi:hypothetical protein